ncbi:MAG: leader peptidase (prepilin peptidase)/N-methyltransferase [Phenylobacterium sp.]|jgi:leader peptidase (prepilin peptidase)/N-methyltransferase
MQMFDNILTLLVNNTGYFYATVILLSLVVGSFLNVVIHRLPIMMEKEWICECREYLADELKPSESKPDELKLGEEGQQAPDEVYNLSLPRSACPKCGHKITALENIPLVSWLVLRGKCSGCQAPISMRYPLVELLTAVLSVIVAAHFGPTPLTLLYIVLTWGLVALTFIDLDTMLLPDQITLPLLWLGLLASVWGLGISPTAAIVGSCVGYLSLWSVYWLFKLLTGKEGMGFGDFKLLAVFGAWLGWQSILLIVLLSSFVGAIFGVFIIYQQKKGKNTPIPFGPYIAIAGWIALLWGDPIIDFYLQQFVYR